MRNLNGLETCHHGNPDEPSAADDRAMTLILEEASLEITRFARRLEAIGVPNDLADEVKIAANQVVDDWRENSQ